MPFNVGLLCIEESSLVYLFSLLRRHFIFVSKKVTFLNSSCLSLLLWKVLGTLDWRLHKLVATCLHVLD